MGQERRQYYSDSEEKYLSTNSYKIKDGWSQEWDLAIDKIYFYGLIMAFLLVMMALAMRVHKKTVSKVEINIVEESSGFPEFFTDGDMVN